MAEFILKDWYGKDCRFDHDKIFVQDANGKLVQFTQGKGNPTLETLEVTENGTYTPSEGVDGFNSVNVAVPIPEVVLQDKTITENGTFTADEGFDGLGSVTVAVEGSGGSALKFYRGLHKITGSINARNSINFGFTPDFLMVYPQDTLSSPGANVFLSGISEKFANAVGTSMFLDGLYAKTSVAWRGSVGNMNSSNKNGLLYNVDSTGFNIGDNYTFVSNAYCYVVAIGL